MLTRVTRFSDNIEYKKVCKNIPRYEVTCQYCINIGEDARRGTPALKKKNSFFGNVKVSYLKRDTGHY